MRCPCISPQWLPLSWSDVIEKGVYISYGGQGMLSEEGTFELRPEKMRKRPGTDNIKARRDHFVLQ